MTTGVRSRRADILAAAEREFAAAGFAGGRMERIAAAAGVNKQLLFHYFGDKDGLFRAALEVLLLRLEPPPARADHPSADLRAVIQTIQPAVSAAPGLLAIVADAAASADFPADAASLVRNWRGRVLVRLQGAVEEGQRRGHYRDDVDPAAVASMALAGALGAGALGSSAPPPFGAAMADYCAWR